MDYFNKIDNTIGKVINKADMTCLVLIYLIVIIGFLINCQDDKMPLKVSDSGLSLLTKFDESDIIHINTNFEPNVQICTWKNNKNAAYTIAFDDYKQSHYQISSIELKKRGMVGTFNLNTKYITEWAPWQQLFNEGHEIASHTWSHCKCTELNEFELRVELIMAKHQILRNIDDISDVPSFTYPFGFHNEFVRKIVMEYHESARGGGGINNSTLSEDEFSMLKGIGVYPPYDINVLNSYIMETLVKKGWLIVYFHSVSDTEKEEFENAPLSLFRQHLDFVHHMKDSLWIATQGQIVNYIQLRDTAFITSEVRDGKFIEVTLHENLFTKVDHGKLSFTSTLPSSWSGFPLVVQYKDTNIGEIITETGDNFYYDIIPGKTLTIFSVNY